MRDLLLLLGNLRGQCDLKSSKIMQLEIFSHFPTSESESVDSAAGKPGKLELNREPIRDRLVLKEPQCIDQAPLW